MAYQANWKRTGILAIGLFVISALVYWLEFNRKPKAEEEEERSKRVFALEDTPVRTIRLVSGSKLYEFECADLEKELCKPGDQSSWAINAPRKLKADQANVNSLLSTLRHLSASETVSLTEEPAEKRADMLKQYGLDTAKRSSPGAKRIEVVSADGKRMVAYLGEEHPVGGKLFTGFAEDETFDETRVLIVPSHVTSNFDRELSYWREKKLFTLNSSDILSFTLNGDKGALRAEKKDDQWVLASAGRNDIPGDIEDIDSLLSSVSYLRAKDFASDDKKDARGRAALGGARKKLSIELTHSSGETKKETLSLVFYEKPGKGKDAKPTLYATVSDLDPLYELDSGTLERLNKGLKDLRLSKLITSMERFTARRLAFEGGALGGKPLVIKQEGSEWKFDGRESELNDNKVQQLLDRLTGSRIDRFLDVKSAPAGMDKGVTFTLGDENDSEKRKLVFWKAQGKLYARDLKSTRDEAYQVHDSVSEALPWSEDHFDRKEGDDEPREEDDHDGHDHGHGGHAH